MKQSITETCDVGHRGKKTMPFSEACMSMKIADKEMEFEIVSDNSVQLWKDGQRFSSTITIGEAGIFRSNEPNGQGERLAKGLPAFYYHKTITEEMYLDWVNNFLTIERFCEHYGIENTEDTQKAMAEFAK
jgi:hypothetical protein